MTLAQMADYIQKSAGRLPHRFGWGHSSGDNCVTVSIDVRAHEIVKAAKENPELQYDVAQRVVLALQGQPLSARIESTEVDPKLLELATNVAPVAPEAAAKLLVMFASLASSSSWLPFGFDGDGYKRWLHL